MPRQPEWHPAVSPDGNQRRSDKAALLAANLTVEDILNGLQASVAMIDAEGDILAVNEGWTRFAQENGGNGSYREYNYLAICDAAEGEEAEDAQTAAHGIRAVLQGERRQFSMEYGCHSVVEKRWYRLAVMPIQGGEPATHGAGAVSPDDTGYRPPSAPRPGALVMHVDITEQVLAKIALRKQQQYYQEFVNSASLGVIAIDVTGAITVINPAFSRLFRLDMKGEQALNVFKSPQWRESGLARGFRRCLDREENVSMETMHCLDSGETIELRINFNSLYGPTGELAGVQGIVEDFTELRKRADLRAYQQKMEAIGSLSAGIAHEINTPIQFAGDNLHFLATSFEEVEAFVETVQAYCQEFSEAGQGRLAASAEEVDWPYLRTEIPQAISETIEGVERVASIVRAMRSLSHPSSAETDLADINDCLQTSLVVSRNEYKYVADLDLDLADDMPMVVCFPGDLKQVFLNLIVNAAYAIKEKYEGTDGRGTIRVVTRLDGEDVLISVGDNGTGIDPAVQKRIFDPFFTTKPVGSGTGQGLALAHAIIARHEGSIRVSSTPGEGTTFDVRLPTNLDSRMEPDDWPVPSPEGSMG